MLTPHTPTPPRWRLSIAICTLERVRSQAQSSAPSAHLPGAHHSTQKQQWTSKRLKEYNLSQPARAFRFYNALWWVTKGSIPCGWASQKYCQKASFIKDRKKQSSRLNFKKNIFQVEKKYLGTLNESLCTLRTYALQHSEVILEENGKLPVNNAFKNARQCI